MTFLDRGKCSGHLLRFVFILQLLSCTSQLFAVSLGNNIALTNGGKNGST